MDSPPLPPEESITKRPKLVWRILFISNIVLGAYIFAKASMKSIEEKKAAKPGLEDHKAAAEVSSTPIVDTTTIPETSSLPQPVMEPVKPVKVLEPIPDDQQRELFQWILEEKRKVKPKDREEKKQIDEEKAILKQFIRANSIPSL